MSYCAIIPFRDGRPRLDNCLEFRNAWGGAARIWDALFEKYLKNRNILWHSWISSDQQALWDLVKRKELPLHERAVHASTLDLAYIRRENFRRFCADLLTFEEAFPVGPKISHLPAWAEAISKIDAEAVGFYGTSVAENPWFCYDEDTNQTVAVPLDEGWEIYTYLTAPAAISPGAETPAPPTESPSRPAS